MAPETLQVSGRLGWISELSSLPSVVLRVWKLNASLHGAGREGAKDIGVPFLMLLHSLCFGQLGSKAPSRERR